MIEDVFNIQDTKQLSWVFTNKNITSYKLTKIDDTVSICCERADSIGSHPLIDKNEVNLDKKLYELINVASKTITCKKLERVTFDSISDFFIGNGLISESFLLNSKWEDHRDTTDRLGAEHKPYVYSDIIPENEIFVFSSKMFDERARRTLFFCGDKFSAIVSDDFIYKVVIENAKTLDEVLANEMDIALE